MSKKPVIFVSSTVYGIEELLERIYTLLTAFGYEVWMSHKGTLPVISKLTAFENCIKGVENCDLFLGLITPHYGSGINKDTDTSITHEEMKKALELKKPRWLLTHDHVVFSRKLLNDMGFNTSEKRKEITLKSKSTSISDLRIIDMYEEAIQVEKPLPERHGNWVQKFETDEDALLFVSSQFSRFQEIEAFIKENFSDPSIVTKKTKRKGDK